MITNNSLFDCQYDNVGGNFVFNYNNYDTPLRIPVINHVKRRSAFVEKSNNFYRLVGAGSFVSRRAGGVSRSSRGIVREFSTHSKNRLFSRIDDYGKKWKTFLTLTYRYKEDWQEDKNCNYLPVTFFGSYNFLDLKKSYDHLKQFIFAINKFYGDKFLFIWKKEFQKNGIVHYHLITDQDFNNGNDRKILREIWGNLTNNDSKWRGVDFQRVKKSASICWYLSKYLSKDNQDDKGYQLKAPLAKLYNHFVGRWWGVFNAKYHSLKLPIKIEIPKTLFSYLYSNLLHLKKISINKKNQTVKNYTPCLRFFLDDKTVADFLEPYLDFLDLSFECDRLAVIKKHFPCVESVDSLESILEV